MYKRPNSADISVLKDVRSYADNPPIPASHGQEHQSSLDEITNYHTTRWIGSAEACWRLDSFSMGAMKPPIQQLQVYLPDHYFVYFDPERQTSNNIVESDKIYQTTLTEYFSLNLIAKDLLAKNQPLPWMHKGVTKNPLDYLYLDIPEHFI